MDLKVRRCPYVENRFTTLPSNEIEYLTGSLIRSQMEGGVIIHGDTHPEQWLRAKDGHLILNDFNNAEILDYHQTEDHYCKPFWDLGGFVSTPMFESFGHRYGSALTKGSFDSPLLPTVPSTRRVYWDAVIH